MTENFNFIQCNIDKNCCCHGLACVHCSFMLWHMYPHFHLKLKYNAIFTLLSMWTWGCFARDHMIVGFTTTSATSAYHHWCCEFKSLSGCTTLCYKVGQWLAKGRWFSQGPPVSSTNKTDRHDITEILLEVALNNINVVLTWHIWSELQTVYRI